MIIIEEILSGDINIIREIAIIAISHFASKIFFKHIL